MICPPTIFTQLLSILTCRKIRRAKNENINDFDLTDDYKFGIVPLPPTLTGLYHLYRKYIMHIRPGILSVVLFSVAIYSGCTTPDSIDTYVTATVKRQLFTSSIVVEGELEAKVVRTLMVPRARMSQPPLVGFLANKGDAVKKNDIVAVFESESLVLEYLLASDEWAIARADLKRQTLYDFENDRSLVEEK